MRRLSKVKILWSPSFAYAIGLLVTDGNLSKDGRHMNITSKDIEIINNFKECLGLKNKIGRKSRGGSKDKKYFQVQFGDINFYEFLLSLGITPAKSRTIGKLNIPNKYFADFLRGCIDGDGNISTSKHPESKHPQLKIRLFSASQIFLDWIKEMIYKNLAIERGYFQKGSRVCILSYGKTDSIKILKYIYYDKKHFHLKRKYDISSVFLN